MTELKTNKTRKLSNIVDPLIDHVLHLMDDLPLYPAHECRKVFQPSHYDLEGYMLLPRFSDANKVFNRSFITKWTNLLRNGLAEKLFNESFNEFTEERRQFRPLLNPKYTSKVTKPDMHEPISKLENHILSILQRSPDDIVLYPSLLYSYSNGTVQVPHSDLANVPDANEEFLLLVGFQGTTSIIVFPRTHLSTSDTQYQYSPLRLSLRPGDILKFHPKLLHAGDKYAECNLRIHYYVLKSMSTLDNITNRPDEEQLLRIVNKSTYEKCTLGVTAKKKKQEERAKRKYFLNKGFSRSVPSESGSMLSGSRNTFNKDVNDSVLDCNDNLSILSESLSNISMDDKNPPIPSAKTESIANLPLQFNVNGPLPNIINLAVHPRVYSDGMIPDLRFKNYVCFDDDVLIPLNDCVVIDGKYYMRSCNPMDYVYNIGNLPSTFFHGVKSLG